MFTSLMTTNRKTRLVFALVVCVLAAALLWSVGNLGVTQVKAGGGEATMNQILTALYQQKFTFSITVNSPAATVYTVSPTGAARAWVLARFGIDHICIKPNADANAITTCHPFANIASFSYSGTLQ